MKLKDAPEDAQLWDGYINERVKYFKRYATDKLIIAKIKMGSNSVITCYRVTVLPLCTISDGCLSMYQVSFDSLLYFQRYAPDKFNIAKIRKGNNSIKTDNRVMVLAFFTSPRSPLSLYQVSFIYLQYFLRYAPDKLTIAKIRLTL